MRLYATKKLSFIGGEEPGSPAWEPVGPRVLGSLGPSCGPRVLGYWVPEVLGSWASGFLRSWGPGALASWGPGS
jgi:hypothetical protein